MAALPATIILDNEAVAALSTVTHPKHRAVLNRISDVKRQRLRRGTPAVLVPVAVRVEAGWDRAAPVAAVVNRVSGARDVPLDRAAADRAVRLRAATGVSFVDATVGEAAQSAPDPVVILTSDVDDMRRLAAAIGGDVRVVGI